jgi:hypothetical protein
MHYITEVSRLCGFIGIVVADSASEPGPDVRMLQSTSSSLNFEKLTVLTIDQLIKKFHTFYGTWKFNTMFTRTCYWTLH